MNEAHRRKHQYRQSADWMVDSDGRPMGLVGPDGELFTLPAGAHAIKDANKAVTAVSTPNRRAESADLIAEPPFMWT